MKLFDQYPGGVWLVDFEFHPKNCVEGDLPHPVCLVALNLQTGELLRVWQDGLLQLEKAPFATDESALFVAFFASAEIGCFLSLNWPLPINLLDLYVEFRCLTNGIKLAHGKGLLGALLHFGISGIGGEEKDTMRDLILSRGPWNEVERQSILDYCESDVAALAKLLPAMASSIDLPRALCQR